MGYEAETLLHTALHPSTPADGAAAQAKILEFVSGYHGQGDVDRVRNKAHQPPRPPRHEKPGPYSGAPKLIDSKPLPSSAITGKDGIRKIPKLATANGFPFLRYKKPQPAFLSRVIRDKLATRINRHAKMQECEVQADKTCGLGAWEDEWDRHVAAAEAEAGLKGRGGREESWTVEWERQRKRYSLALREDARQTRERTRKLTEILVKETELYAREVEMAKLRKQGMSQREAEETVKKMVDDDMKRQLGWKNGKDILKPEVEKVEDHGRERRPHADGREANGRTVTWTPAQGKSITEEVAFKFRPKEAVAAFPRSSSFTIRRG